MKDKYHIDLFGTLVRLFPLFDFPNNDADNIIISDIELNDEDMDYLKTTMQYNSAKNEIIIRGTLKNVIIDKNFPHFFLGMTLFNKLKLPADMIVNFIESAHKLEDQGFYGTRKTDFGFGIDEIFLDKYIMKHALEHHIDIGLIFDYNINSLLFIYSYSKLIEDNKTNYDYLKFILGKHYKSKFTLDDMLKFVDKNTYGIKYPNSVSRYLSYRFYKLVNSLTSNDVFFHKSSLNFLKWFHNIIFSTSVIYLKKIPSKVQNDIIKVDIKKIIHLSKLAL